MHAISARCECTRKCTQGGGSSWLNIRSSWSGGVDEGDGYQETAPWLRARLRERWSRPAVTAARDPSAPTWADMLCVFAARRPRLTPASGRQTGVTPLRG